MALIESGAPQIEELASRFATSEKAVNAANSCEQEESQKTGMRPYTKGITHELHIYIVRQVGGTEGLRENVHGDLGRVLVGQNTDAALDLHRPEFVAGHPCRIF